MKHFSCLLKKAWAPCLKPQCQAIFCEAGAKWLASKEHYIRAVESIKTTVWSQSDTVILVIQPWTYLKPVLLNAVTFLCSLYVFVLHLINLCIKDNWMFGDCIRNQIVRRWKSADFLCALRNKGPTVLTKPDREEERGALTQQVFRAVCVVVIVIREMVDPVTAALIDACRTNTTRKSLHINDEL